MARGRVKKSAHKGKGKATGPSSSPVRKTKSVDEVTRIEGLKIPSLIKETTVADELDEVTMVIQQHTLEE